MIASVEITDKQYRLNNIVNKINESKLMKEREFDPNYIRELDYDEDMKFIHQKNPQQEEDFEMQSVIFNKLGEEKNVTNLKSGESPKESETATEVQAQAPPTAAAPGDNWPNNELKMEELHIQKPEECCYPSSRVYCHLSY